jgi:hypothetical protein
VTGFLASKDIVDVKDIIAVLIVIPIILDSFAGFGQYSSRVSRGLVVEARVAYAVGGREVGCQRLKRADESALWISAPICGLYIHARLQFLHRLDLLELGNWTATGHWRGLRW